MHRAVAPVPRSELGSYTGSGIERSVNSRILRSVLLVPALGACTDDGVDTNTPDPNETMPAVRLSGHAFNFGEGGIVAGGAVSILELPERTTTTGEDGAFAFDDIPGDAEVTLVMHAEGLAPIQTATFQLAGEDMERIAFQVPSHEVYNTLAQMVDLTPDPTKCQIASTVTRNGNSLYDTVPGTHGEPGATVTIEPGADQTDGPIYFDLLSFTFIFPKRSLSETTDDGGVLFLNVEPGTYTLRAQKPDTTFRDVKITCRVGMLTNASPPWGIQAIEGGVGLRTEPNWGGEGE